MSVAPVARGAAADRQVAARRAVEALRSGVPSRAAVTALGAAQTNIEDRFSALLDQVRNGPAGTPRPGGLLVGGGFGAGKSHLLEHLTHLALQADFVVSRVVVSKETPLYDPVKLFRAAAESALLPNGYEQGSALAEAAAALDAGSAAWVELSRWVNSPHSELNERFPATLLLFGRLGRQRRRAGRGDHPVLVRRPDPRSRPAPPPARDGGGSLRPAGRPSTRARAATAALRRPPAHSGRLRRMGGAVGRGRADRPLLGAAAGSLLRRAGPLGTGDETDPGLPL